MRLGNLLLAVLAAASLVRGSEAHSIGPLAGDQATASSVGEEAAAIGASVAAAGPTAADDALWITLGSDAFAIAHRSIRARSGRVPVMRLDEVGGVVLARASRASLDALGEEIHRELLRCGGYIVHASLVDARAALARGTFVARAPGDLGFLIDQPQWVEAVAGAVDQGQILATITTLSTDFVNRYHAHPSGLAAASWIRDLWVSYAASRPDVTVTLVTHTTTLQPSVVLTIPGSTLANEVIVVGGHLRLDRARYLESELPGAGC